MLADAPTKNLLNLRGKVRVPKLGESFNPNFFGEVNEKWLYVSPILKRIFGKMVEKDEIRPVDAHIEVFDLAKSAFDREIIAQLPERHTTDPYVILNLVTSHYKGNKSMAREVLLDRANENTVFYIHNPAYPDIKGEEYPVIPIQVRYEYGKWYIADWSYDGESAWPAHSRVVYQTK